MATATIVATCPDCGRKIALRPQIQVGDEMICPHCETELEVVSLDPPELDWSWIEPADDEDWEDED